MKILVCVKQVFGPESIIEIDSDNEVVYGASAELRMNRYDSFALESALTIKETFKNVMIDVVSVGTADAIDVIKRSLGMGADRGIHVLCEAEGYISARSVADYISSAVHLQEYDLILTGLMSEDMMQAQTGQMIAALAGIPYTTVVTKLSPIPDKNQIEVEREVENGAKELLMSDMPALFTMQAGINTPRYPTLSNILKADSKEIITVKADDQTRPSQSISFNFPEKTRAGIFLTGTTMQKAEKLYTLIKEKNGLKYGK